MHKIITKLTTTQQMYHLKNLSSHFRRSNTVTLRHISLSVNSSKMPLKYAANLSMLFKEIPDLAERYSAAKTAGFTAVEVSFPYDSPVEKLIDVKEREGLEQVLINSFPGEKKCLFKVINQNGCSHSAHTFFTPWISLSELAQAIG